MIKRLRCYNYKRLLEMLNMVEGSIEHEKLMSIVKKNNCFIFQPPFIKATNGPCRRPDKYLTTCKELDNYIAPFQTLARLKETHVANSQYKECMLENTEISEDCKLGQKIGLFTFY